MNHEWVIEHFLKTKLIATGVIVFLLILSRYFIVRYIRSAERNWTAQQRLKWIGSARSTAFVLLVLSVIYLWGETIQGFAVSVFAIMFAMVFSVKELFMCINGTVLKLRGHLFEIGDRIEIKGIKGDVIDVTLLSTTVQEVGSGAASHQFTGRRISFPNNFFLTECLINESFLENYYMNNIKIPLAVGQNWKRAKDILHQIASEECAPYLEQARRRIQQMERSRALELPSVEPRVTIHLPDSEEIHLHVRVPSPVHLRGRLEQVVVTRFLEQFYGDFSPPVK
ncbi:MAG: mechanosensitive ion channel family protein [Simkaniaceae bacterium]|nr:mechanosensitive ion channel family protein [Simkaniaceae bacterium]